MHDEMWYGDERSQAATQFLASQTSLSQVILIWSLRFLDPKEPLSEAYFPNLEALAEIVTSTRKSIPVDLQSPSTPRAYWRERHLHPFSCTRTSRLSNIHVSSLRGYRRHPNICCFFPSLESLPSPLCRREVAPCEHHNLVYPSCV